METEIIKGKDYILNTLKDIKNEQKRINNLMLSHAQEDAKNAIELASILSDIKVQMARLESKVEAHSGNFGKAWALVAPVIITIIITVITGKGTL